MKTFFFTEFAYLIEQKFSKDVLKVVKERVFLNTRNNVANSYYFQEILLLLKQLTIITIISDKEFL